MKISIKRDFFIQYGLIDENSEKNKYKVNSFGYISKSINLAGF